ncbi:hypothetical protein H1230_08730 [Paenibacillus sp. 19GGS1-52]|uniref:DUF5353 domain-containing protein n=1 Tax=Paenibacillus sp. 19GGS1-52 TaxID=2758563 RepID=UPI001EFA7C46|nr:DUF5353 domain-containing protein [Paenibacillus sp. 19GGS1-52]ULO08845.1 hypothetical protein H1230_08730 [Paenibacillus sp. 19GGS1-52]
MDSRKGRPKRIQSSSDPKKIILRPRRVDYPRQDREHSEEYAAEVSPLPMHVRNPAASEATEVSEPKEVGTEHRMMGYVGLAFGIVSLFIWSIVIGPIAAVVGYYAYAKGQKTAGAWAMGLGIVATLSYFVMIPFAR